MRLFRQKEAGDGEGVFRRMAAELRRLVARKAGCGQARVEVSPGELVDRITILEIKEGRLEDPDKRAAVRAQLAALRRAYSEAVAERAGLSDLVAGLRAVNEALWEAEDGLRVCERAGDFGPRFVALARSVYLRNDERSALKQRVNDLLGSDLGEPKAYGPGG
jgi:hypothetical protein